MLLEIIVEMMAKNKTYLELTQLKTYEERLNYLKTYSSVGVETFGSGRYLNQLFYRSPEWKAVRKKVILRDNANDMALDDYPIRGIIIIHHINPITIEDIKESNSLIFDMNNLISVSFGTHQKIHYGIEKEDINATNIQRMEGDTKLW
jgi:hypothetical protein